MREGQLRVVTGEPGNDGRLEPEEEDMPCFIFLVMDAMERFPTGMNIFKLNE